MRLLFVLGFVLGSVQAQTSFRGMHAVDTGFVWISGNKGAVYTYQGGLGALINCSPAGYGNKDFRSIYAWDRNTAIVISVSDSTVVLRTTNGGLSWNLVYLNNTQGIFFDDLDIKNNMGIAIADPMPKNNAYYYPIISSADSGKTWQEIYPLVAQNADSTGGLFSASGSNIVLFKNDFAFCSGGAQALFIRKNTKVVLPIKSGGSYGPYSMDRRGKNWVIGGGNYAIPTHKDSIACLSRNHGKTWKLLKNIPIGYISCIKFVGSKKKLLCVGTQGVCASKNRGKTWKIISNQGFNTAEVFGNKIWLIGKTLPAKSFDFNQFF